MPIDPTGNNIRVPLNRPVDATVPSIDRTTPPTLPDHDRVDTTGRPRVPVEGRIAATPLPKPDEQSPAGVRLPQEWPLGPMGRALAVDISHSLNLPEAELERILTEPMWKLERSTVEELTNKRVSPRAVRLLKQELSRVAGALERRGDRHLAEVARRVGTHVPSTLDAFGAKMLWDLTQRLPKTEDRRINDVHFTGPGLQGIAPALIREANFSFTHPAECAARTDGYRLYFSSTPPNPDGTFVADHQFEMGKVLPAPSGDYAYHFVDKENALNADAPYYVWVTAYNSAGESAPSAALHERFPAAARGDLNKDGVIDSADVDKMVRILTGEAEVMVAADVNGDGVITQADLDALIAMIR